MLDREQKGWNGTGIRGDICVDVYCVCDFNLGKVRLICLHCWIVFKKKEKFHESKHFSLKPYFKAMIGLRVRQVFKKQTYVDIM